MVDKKVTAELIRAQKVIQPVRTVFPNMREDDERDFIILSKEREGVVVSIG